jgi:hypothetical protein
MAPNASPTISITPIKAGRGYSARIIWQSGEPENIVDFRDRDEATSWVVNHSAAWISSHRMNAALCRISLVDTPRPTELKNALSAGRLAYDTLSPGTETDTLPPRNMALHRNFPVPSIERMDIDRRQIDIVQAAHIDVDLFWV